MRDVYLPRCPWHTTEMEARREALVDEVAGFTDRRESLTREEQASEELRIRQSLAIWFHDHRRSCQDYMTSMVECGQADGYYDAKAARDDVNHKANGRRIDELQRMAC